jgi:HB1, ASXL, restriction endonuclease HTH domain
MKKNEVKIGECYMAKVTNSEVPVRIDAESPHGGWDAKNVATGRKVRIKSAQRLRRPCTQADLAGLGRPKPKQRRKGATEATTSPTAATGAKPAKGATKKATGAKGRNTGQTGAKAAKPAKPKRISGLTAAFMVLVDAGGELGVKQIVETAAEKGWWKSDAATPAATVYAAMIREIATKGSKSRFKRGSKRGTFRAICSPEQKRELFAAKA